MRSPKPAIPKCAPADIDWFGGPIEWFSITLRITGEKLDPQEVSRVLGCQPAMSARKGEPNLNTNGTVVRIASTGTWHLKLSPSETDEWDCGEAIMVLMNRLPSDLEAWRSLTQEFKADVFVGLSMASRNKGFSLRPDVMAYLAERRIEAGFDIYCDEK